MKEKIIAKNMMKIQKGIFGNIDFQSFDLVKLTNTDRLTMEDHILNVFPDVINICVQYGERFNMTDKDAFKVFFVDAYILMIKYIKKRHMEWMDINKPELYDSIERALKA